MFSETRARRHQFHDSAEQYSAIVAEERRDIEREESRISKLVTESSLRDALQHAIHSLAHAPPSMRPTWLREVRKAQIALKIHRELRTRQTTLLEAQS